MRQVFSIPDALPTASVAVMIGTVPAGATATGLDGSANLVCATNKVAACKQGSGSVTGEASTFDLPAFMFVDFKAKVVHAQQSDHRQHVVNLSASRREQPEWPPGGTRHRPY